MIDEKCRIELCPCLNYLAELGGGMPSTI
jgi:hypothetical protein